MNRSLNIFAPAKVNLYLHIVGRRDNGYHELDSMVAFADIGDQIKLEKADSFSFVIDGPFRKEFSEIEKDSSVHSSNLVVKAAHYLSALTGKDLNVQITLTKDIPLAAGMGGGSADAAATIKALAEWWGLKIESIRDIGELLLGLGADVPVCIHNKMVRMQGIGEDVSFIACDTELPAVLVNPLVPCSTVDVFAAFDRNFGPVAADFVLDSNLVQYLALQSNDLLNAAASVAPVISDVLDTLKKTNGVKLARMSGSGATCFGVFENNEEAQMAARGIREKNPQWWVVPATLNKAL